MFLLPKRNVLLPDADHLREVPLSQSRTLPIDANPVSEASKGDSVFFDRCGELPNPGAIPDPGSTPSMFPLPNSTRVERPPLGQFLNRQPGCGRECAGAGLPIRLLLQLVDQRYSRTLGRSLRAGDVAPDSQFEIVSASTPRMAAT